jgi:hypothetical protein
MPSGNPEKSADSGDQESTTRAVWEPAAIVDVGHGCRVGITTDDGCFLVLYPEPGGGWRPGTHIPRQAVQKMSELLAEGCVP